MESVCPYTMSIQIKLVFIIFFSLLCLTSSLFLPFIHTEGQGDTRVIRYNLQNVYRELLLTDLEYALDKKLEQELWNNIFKNHVSSLQAKVRDKMVRALNGMMFFTPVKLFRIWYTSRKVTKKCFEWLMFMFEVPKVNCVLWCCLSCLCLGKPVITDVVSGLLSSRCWYQV